jgi:two-component system, cell cycle sensor histidine kinase and response regulator CckA
MASAAPTLSPPQPASSARMFKTALVVLFLLTAGVWLSSRGLLASNFLPHWYCLVGNKRLLWTTVIADTIIGLSYVAISVTLATLVRRAGRDLPYAGFFWAFGLFIVSCGATHFLEVVTVWKPVYWLAAATKVLTAAMSAGTALVLLIAAEDIVDFVHTAREAVTRRGFERFRALVEAAPMAVVSSDLEGKITAWNPTAEHLFGWSAREAVGKSVPLVPPEKVDEYDQLRLKTIAGEITKGLETLRLNRDGESIPVSISTAPVSDENGLLAGTIAVIEDITERKRIAHELKQLEQQVLQAQKMEVLGRLAGGVAHDFNNMLMVIGGCSELLERSLPLETPARVYLDEIQRTSQKAAAITKQLLAFSRKQVLELRPLDLHEALTDSEFMLPRLLGSDVQLSFRHEAAKSWILSDPAQIEQVVANLAINARDAMLEGGRLTISTRNATQVPENGVGQARQTADWVVLEVEDTGCGMDDKTRAQIFEPFFTTKAAGKGTGLGLATVYGIVKQGGGHIRVDSTPGVGTRFEIYFPVVARQEEEIQQASSRAGGSEEPGGGITVLVADDEAALRNTIVEILRSSGYNVLESQTAEDALEIARQNAGKIDILLTDIVMPGLRGPELARRVQNIQPDVKVVFMSGYAEGLPEAELPPNSAFLQKPFRFATLLEQLKLIRRRA